MVVVILMISIYVCLIAWFIVGWHKTATLKLNTVATYNTKASIVVACKNEAQTLPDLFHALHNQSNQNFQLILVDDNSTDNTLEVMQLAKSFSDVLILKSNGTGKKQALKTGIEQASNELIITTDADCSPTSTWVEAIYSFYNQQPVDLIIGPVEMKAQSTFFERLQQLEFQTLIASGAGAAGNQHAIMCNGANLAFHKADWLAQFTQLKPHLLSGDDVFLLHALKNEGRKIQFLKSSQAMVYTHACATLHQFYKQRKRWASKTPAYTDLDTILVASIIFSVCSVQLFFIVASCFNNTYLTGLLAITSFKFLLDLLFINQTKQLFQKRKTALSTFALAVVYPFYIVISAFAGIKQGLNDKRTNNFR